MQCSLFICIIFFAWARRSRHTIAIGDDVAHNDSTTLQSPYQLTCSHGSVTGTFGTSYCWTWINKLSQVVSKYYDNLNLIMASNRDILNMPNCPACKRCHDDGRLWRLLWMRSKLSLKYARNSVGSQMLLYITHLRCLSQNNLVT